ncbi:MAG TPA: lysophospholipid acyltransferase family protein [Kofleriaceae bacterium]|nr:lysophospholipid acyltransferase family protein [Kofleriaceae bacterium]
MAPRRRVLLLALAVALAAAAPASAGRASSKAPQRLRLHRGAVKVARTLLRPGKRRLSSMRVVGAEHVAGVKGSVVLAANHIAGLDPIAIALASPKPIHFYAKAELFRVPVLGRLVRAAGAVPIDRGKVDLDELNRVSSEALAGDHALGVFTEGTLAPWSESSLPRARAELASALASGKNSARRTRWLERKQRHLRTSVIYGGKSKSGAAYQAVVNDRPIVPVVVLGTRAMVSAPRRFFAWLRGAAPPTGPPRGTGVTVVFGPPIAPPTEGSEIHRVRTLRDEVDRALRELARPYLAPGQDELW